MRISKGTAAVAIVCSLALGLVACSDDGGGGSDTQAAAAVPAEPTAGNWKTWVLASPLDVMVAPPPVKGSPEADADAAEVRRAAASRSEADRAAVAKWSDALPTRPWTEMAFDLVSKSAKNPPLSSRNYALLQAAMHDAVVASWYWKYAYKVDPPGGVDTLVPAGADPSYPSEHAAMAGAASRVLAHLYPASPAEGFDAMADEAARSRVVAGTNTPSATAAGLELGRGVAEKVVRFADSDGSDRQWDGRRPPGIGRGPAFWEPPPGAVSPPTAPLAGTWKTWVLPNGSQLRPPPPPAFGSPEFRAAAQEIVDIGRNLTPEQQQIARFYEGAEGTSLPAGIIVNVAQEDVLKAATSDLAGKPLSIPRITRALSLLTVAIADAGVAVWDAKFAYWNPRPENGIRDLGLDPHWKPMLPTPRFPAYPSGSAGYAGAAQAVMTYLFPSGAAEFAKRAEDQAASRLYAGIHWRYDSVSLDMGRAVGAMVVERAKDDGADTGAT